MAVKRFTSVAAISIVQAFPVSVPLLFDVFEQYIAHSAASIIAVPHNYRTTVCYYEAC